MEAVKVDDFTQWETELQTKSSFRVEYKEYAREQKVREAYAKETAE